MKDKEAQLIWEAYIANESEFDDWQLPSGAEDWRDKHKAITGRVMPDDPEETLRLVLKGEKPAGMFANAARMYVNKAAEYGAHVEEVPEPREFPPNAASYRPVFIVGMVEKWTKMVAAVFERMRYLFAKTHADDGGLSPEEDQELGMLHKELGKGLGYGEHSKDIRKSRKELGLERYNKR